MPGGGGPNGPCPAPGLSGDDQSGAELYPPGTAGYLCGGDTIDAFVKLVAAGPLFFVSAWLLMIFAGIVGADVGIEPFGYVTSSMVVTIALWLTLASAIGAAGRAPGKKQC